MQSITTHKNKGKARRQNGRRLPTRQHRDAATGLDSAPGPFTGTVREQGFTIKSMPLFGFRTRRNVQYYSQGTINGTNAAGTYVFSANGLYDPDITGTGGQPMGFDQLMLYYNHYTVVKSRCRVVIQNASTGGTIATAALSVSGTNIAVTNVENLVDNGDISFQSLLFPGAYGSSCTLMRSLDVGLFQGIDHVMDDPQMRGDVSSNPLEQVYYHLSVWNPASVAAVGVLFQILIEFDTIFHEPRKGPSS